jgi:hypothetical protein
MTQNDQQNSSSEFLQETPAVYYCRGCGKPLPEGSKARFHADCRRTDKRGRVALRRQREARRETRRFRAHIRNLNCPECGANLAKLAQRSPGHSVQVVCDVAQHVSEPLNFPKRLAGA